MNLPEIFREAIKGYKNGDQESIRIFEKILTLPEILTNAMEIITSNKSDLNDKLISGLVIKYQITHIGYELNIEDITTRLVSNLLCCLQNNCDFKIIENLLYILSDIQIIYFGNRLIIGENVPNSLLLLIFLKDILYEFQKEFVGAFMELNKIIQKKNVIVRKSIDLLTRTNFSKEWLDLFMIVYESVENKIDMFGFLNVFREIIGSNLNDEVVFVVYEMILDSFDCLYDFDQYLNDYSFDDDKLNEIFLQLLTNLFSLSFILTDYFLLDPGQYSDNIYNIWELFNEETFQLITERINNYEFINEIFLKYPFVIDNIQFKQANSLILFYSKSLSLCYEYISPEILSKNIVFLIDFTIKNQQNNLGIYFPTALETLFQIDETLFIDYLTKLNILDEGVLYILYCFSIPKIRSKCNIDSMITNAINILMELLKKDEFSQKGFLLISQNLNQLNNDFIAILLEKLVNQSFESSCILKGCIKLLYSNKIMDLVQNNENIKFYFSSIVQKIMKVSETFSSITPMVIEFILNLGLKSYFCDEEKMYLGEFILSYFSEFSKQILNNIRDSNYFEVKNNVNILSSSINKLRPNSLLYSKSQIQSSNFLLFLKNNVGNVIINILNDLFSLNTDEDIQSFICDIINQLINYDCIGEKMYIDLQTWISNVFKDEPFSCHFDVLKSIFDKKKLILYTLSFNSDNNKVIQSALDHLNYIFTNDVFITLIQNGFNIWNYIFTIDFIDKCLSSYDALLQSSCIELLCEVFFKSKIPHILQVDHQKEFLIIIFLIRGLVLSFSQELFYKIQDEEFAEEFIKLLLVLVNRNLEQTKMFFNELNKTDILHIFIPKIRNLMKIETPEVTLLNILGFLSFKQKFLLDIQQRNTIKEWFDCIIFTIKTK